jgi:PDZ domain-containing protein
MGGIASPEAYDQLLNWMEQDSESGAVISAYRQLNKPIDIEYEGVMIRGIEPNAPISSSFSEGDIITAVNGVKVNTLTQLRDSIQGKGASDAVRMTVKRGQQSIEANVNLMELTTDAGTRAAGLGIRTGQLQKPVVTEDIGLQFDDIGGPSVGMMMTLQLLTQLGGKDLTRGYVVAGTGTIDTAGNVGQVGGVKHKVKGASWAHADYFFVPKDSGNAGSNEDEAKQTAASLDTSMKVVPVATLAEAVVFLENLPVKP